jgi:hypothetical protein
MPDSMTHTSDAMTQLNRAHAERQLQRIKARTLIALIRGRVAMEAGVTQGGVATSTNGAP